MAISHTGWEGPPKYGINHSCYSGRFLDKERKVSGEHCFSWGPRAEAEVDKKELLAFVAEVRFSPGRESRRPTLIVNPHTEPKAHSGTPLLWTHWGPGKSVLYREVSSFQGLIYSILGTQQSPHFRCVL